jgi:hypothetical protein
MMIKAACGKKAKSRARASLKKDKGKRIRDKTGKRVSPFKTSPTF